MIVEIKGEFYNLTQYTRWYKDTNTGVDAIVLMGRISDNIYFDSIEELESAWTKICEAVERVNNPPIISYSGESATAFGTRIHETIAELTNKPLKRACNAVTPKSPAEIKAKVLAHIRALRAQGNTYKYIAGKLNSEGVATFSGKGTWHVQTVHRVVKG